MNKIILPILLVTCALNCAWAQFISEDTYCIRLKAPSGQNYFSDVSPDSIPEHLRAMYEKELIARSRLLSGFGEEPLNNAGREIFRSVVYSATQPLKNIQILKIEKRDKEVELSIKVIRNLKDSTVLVHKKTFGLSQWSQFQEIASRLFVNQPLMKKVNNPVHDGSVTVYEGHLSGRYHLIERRAVSITDPALEEINSFLRQTLGSFFYVNCRKDTREN
jgi:hypothetical protein